MILEGGREEGGSDGDEGRGKEGGNERGKEGGKERGKEGIKLLITTSLPIHYHKHTKYNSGC